MKAGIHPQNFESAVTCGGCGNSFTVGSVLKSINVSVCCNCHPFYTGSNTTVDTAGRVDKFKEKYAKFMAK